MNKIKEIAKALDSAIYKLNLGVGWFCSGGLIVLALFVFVHVLSRIVNIPLPFLFSLSVYALVVFTFLSAAFTLGAGRHVSIDLITGRLSDNSRVTLRILGHVIVLFFTLILGWEASTWAYSAFVKGMSTLGTLSFSTLPWPFWIIILPVSLGTLLLVLQCLRLIVRDADLLRSNSPTLKTTILPAGLVVIILLIGISIAIYINPVAGLFISLLTLFFTGVPVAFSMGCIGILGIYFFAGGMPCLIQSAITAFSGISKYTIACLPLFVITGTILGEAGESQRLFRFVETWFGRFPGSLLLVSILTGMILCAITGSSVAATAMLALICIGPLVSRGFDRKLSCGTIGGASVGTLIPPSMAAIIYGSVTEESIGHLFMAMLFPGLMIFAFYIIYIFILTRTSREKFGKFEEAVSWKERFSNLKNASLILGLPVLILGGIYYGILTPTEAAGAAVIYALLGVGVILRTLNFEKAKKASVEACHASSMTLWVLTGGLILASVVSQLQVDEAVLAWMEAVGIQKWSFVAILFVILLVMGMFMATTAMMLITIPVFYPVALALGIHPLWLGVFYAICGEIGLLTPPVGVNLFLIQGITGYPFREVVMGLLPFVGILAFSVLMLYLFPQLATWLPSTM